jgi:CRP/FNR family cyclic AMP-dependent transcriptional regulator
MDPGKSRPSIHEDLFPIVGPEGMHVEFKGRSTVLSQGDLAESVFYILKGKVKLTVLSKQGKEAIVGALNGGSFFGEGCLGLVIRFIKL